MNGPVASEKNQIGSCVNKPGGDSNLKYRYQMKNNIKYNRKFTNMTP
jgi:hypothetical protein